MIDKYLNTYINRHKTTLDGLCIVCTECLREIMLLQLYCYRHFTLIIKMFILYIILLFVIYMNKYIYKFKFFFGNNSVLF